MNGAGGEDLDARDEPGGAKGYRSSRDVGLARRSSALRRYQAMVIGSDSLWELLKVETITFLLSGLPGAAGIALRAVAYPWILGACGKGVVIGRGVIVRHPRRIHLGNRVMIDDGCVLDARSDDGGIHIGDDVILSRRVTLSCKDGEIRIGSRTGIGTNSTVHSVGGSAVRVGSDCVIAPYVYLVGGSHYRTDRLDIPIAEQGLELRGGVVVGDGCWLGARATVLDGTALGAHSIVGAGAVVTRSVPDFSVAVGLPARVVADRRESKSAAASPPAVCSPPPTHPPTIA
ncbi:MAG: acyltransferase [Candidatus Schekmanbacteria bacterium]|nr:acyltransferase [Candidatus Schekmanbacteria bacterium]